MGMQLVQRPELRQEMSISLIITQQKMLKYRNFGDLLKSIAENPEIVEEFIDNIKYDGNGDANRKDGVLSSLVFLFDSEKNVNRKNGGLIMNSGLGGLEEIFDIGSDDLSADVIYVAKENAKPELHFNDRLIFKSHLLNVEIPKKLKHTNNIYSNILGQHQWQSEILRKTYSIIGEKQREFIQSLDKLCFNKYDIEDLTKDLELRSSTTTYKLLQDRIIGIDSLDYGGVSYYKSMNLLNTNDEIRGVYTKDKLIKYILSEKKLGVVLSDQQICDKLNLPVERRTVAKYRNQLGIPAQSKRKRIYMRK